MKINFTTSYITYYALITFSLQIQNFIAQKYFYFMRNQLFSDIIIFKNV